MDNSLKVFESEKTLSLLKEIESNSHLTQRYLAQKLEVSLGKINFLIKALLDKGIIEIKNFKTAENKKIYKYLLTLEGFRIKLELSRKFLAWKLQQYEELKEEIECFKKEHPAELGSSPALTESQLVEKRP